MKKAFGAILIAVILIVCVVTLTVQRGENAMLEFPERPAEGCTVMSLEITDGKAQTEVIGTYNVNENVLTIKIAPNAPRRLKTQSLPKAEKTTHTRCRKVSRIFISVTPRRAFCSTRVIYTW